MLPRDEPLSLRRSVEADVAPLVSLLRAPEVAAWWGTNTPDDVRQELRVGWTILVGERVAGWLLVHEELEPEYRHAALDVVLAADLHGRGYGPDALRLAICRLAGEGHHPFTIDPAVANVQAIRAYEKVGFRPVGVERQAERGPDGVWRDALRMDLLAAELT